MSPPASRPDFRFLGAAVATALLAACALPPPVSPGRQPASPGASAPASAPFVRGNDARLLVDGPATHEAMFDAMARARDHINLETYILDSGEAGERLATVLADKVKQGVKVHLIYDSVGSVKTPKEYFQRLRDAGVAVCEFNPVKKLGKVNNRDHRKILVVDGRTAFTGGVNISRTYSSGSASARRKPAQDSEEKKEDGWRDTHVAVQGPVVAQFQRLFLDAWALQDCGAWAEASYYPKLEPAGDKLMRVVRSDPGADPGAQSSEMYLTLLSAIREARSRVWLTVGYFVPDPQTREILGAAARRGVDVRLVLPGFSDFWAPVYAGRSYYEELLEAGVHIYEWHDALMHAKTAVIDSVWSSVGSTNLDWRSFVHNYEADVIVRDAGFARELERRFRLDLRAAEEIRLDAWRRRAAGDKLKEWLARQWEYLL